MDSQLQSILFFAIPFLQLLVLSFLSRVLFTRLAWFLQSFMRRSKWVYYFLAFLFLPGTYVHELSHYIMAKILFVPTFNMSLWPKIEDKTVRLGSVEIGKTDFVRRFFVGAAPFLFGTLLLLYFMYLSVTYQWYTTILGGALSIFIIFEIGNTMFMSKKDWEGSWKMLILLISIGILVFLFGFDATGIMQFIEANSEFEKSVISFLAVPIAIDILLIFLLSLFV